MPEQQGLEITPIIDPSDVIGFIIAAIIVVAPFFIIIALLKWISEKIDALPPIKLGKKSSTNLSFFPRDILTTAEFKFFLVLQNICQNKLYIIPKMGLWALVDHRDNVTAWNKISRKHLDFTLCHPRTMKPVLVIELDDSSHRNPKQQRRDAEKDAILAQAGVPVLRVPVARQYDESAIRYQMSQRMKRN